MPTTPDGRRGAEQRLDAELQFHLDQRVADLIADGVPPDQAKARARREFGGVEQVKEACRDERRTRWLDDTWRDIRVAVRSLRRAPVFSAVAILTLTLGIGANVAVFQVLDALMLRPLPVANADELRQIRVQAGDGNRSGNFRGRSPDLTAGQVASLQQALPELGLAVWSNLQFNLADTGEVRNADGLRVNGDYFRVLGVSPILGRLLGPADDTPACDTGAVVISEAFWTQSFGRRPDVLGQPLRLDGHRFEVVGVLPARFFGTEVGRRLDLAVPLCTERTMTVGTSMFDIKSGWWLAALARRPEGMSDAQLAARLAALAPALFRETLPDEYRPELADRYLTFSFELLDAGTGVSPLRSTFSGPLVLLGAITGMVLLIACANLANLLLARASHRERELAVRLAIGSSKARLVRHSAAEAVVLTVIGTILGTALAFTLSRGLVDALGSANAPVHLALQMNWTLLAFTALTATFTALLCAVAPALRSSHVPPASALRDGLRTSSSGGTLSWRRVLIVSEVALTFVLLVGALLFARSLGNLQGVNVGFDPRGLVELRVQLGRLPGWQERRPGLREALLERLQARPWVTSVSDVFYLPIGGSSWNDTIEVEGLSRSDVLSQLNRVGVDYFATLGVPVIEGRGFTPRDRTDTPPIAVVNRAFKERYFEGTPVVGRRLRFLSEPTTSYEVVGVVGDTKYGSIREDTPPTIFVAAAQDVSPPPDIPLLVRSTLDPAATVAALGREVAAVSPSLTFRTRVVPTVIDDTLRIDRLLAALSVSFGALAVLLAGIGLYGVIAYVAAQREHEIGIRLALGATRPHVIGRVVRDTTWLVAAGIGIGLIGAVLASRAVSSLLFGLENRDVWSYLAALILLTLVGLAASVLPAWRASRTSPMRALRQA